MNDTEFFTEVARAQAERRACALATVVASKGSVPREAGAKMLVYADGATSGTVGGGKFESLVIAQAVEAVREGKPCLKHYLLREGEPQSFGAICGGEVDVFIEAGRRCGSSAAGTARRPSRNWRRAAGCTSAWWRIGRTR